MKYPVYWFLVSSGLIASNTLSFAAAQQENLSSSDSYNGNTAGNATFTPKSTSNSDGTVYTCTGDVCIAYAGKTTPLSGSCFSQSAGDLSFIGNGYSLCFESITATGKPGAIETTVNDKNVSISDFSMFNCSFCPPGVTGSGAIKSMGTTTFDKDVNILFQKNCSSTAGGAVNCKGLVLKGTSGIANFIENKSSDNGGAIESSGESFIENNTGIISFLGNSSEKQGGAIHSENSITVSNNNSVVFSKNTTTGSSGSSGGAVYCNGNSQTPKLKFEGNKQLSFIENTSTTSGGAIYAKKLTINSGGTTVFSNNSTTNANPKGGAICLDTSGECSLTAELGDIIFDGNKIITTGNSSSIKRNAIDLNTSGKFTKLSAKEGFGIYFYDPIADSGDNTTAIELNKTENAINYTGKIVFSGETLSAQEKTQADNLTSTFKQPVTLSAGSLILKDGVTVEAKSFTQTQGSAVIMDVGTTLRTPSNDGDAITLPNLSINIASLGGGGTPSSAKIQSQTTGKQVTVTDISYVDEDGHAYEYPVFSKTRDFASAITLLAANGTQVTAPTHPATPLTPAPHYGYQGNWSISWKQGTGTNEQNATLSWKQTGYLPNPERQGPLVPNTLWGSFSDIRAIQNLMDVNVNGADYQRGFWVSGLANFLHKSGSATKRKFRHNSAGYVLGVFAHTPADDIFSAAFCQLFGKDKDYLVAKNNAHIYAGSIYYQHTSFWSAWENLLQNTIGAQAPLVLNAQLTYSHTSNDMKTNMTTKYAPRNVVYPEIKGDWGNDCFGIELGAVVPIESQYSSLFDIYSPFLKFQLVHAHQEDFKENSSTEGRYFESSNLTNLSMPIGVKFERFSENDRASYNLTLAYAPDIARSNPDCASSLLVSPTTAVWLTKASNLARQAFIVRAGNYLSLSSNFEIFSQFGFELRGSSRTYNVDLGSKIQF